MNMLTQGDVCEYMLWYEMRRKFFVYENKASGAHRQAYMNWCAEWCIETLRWLDAAKAVVPGRGDVLR